METPTSVQYCPQANEPGGGANPPESFAAVVEEVEGPFRVTLTYCPFGPETAFRVTSVPAAGPSAKAPVPGCYQPAAGTAFPIGYVQPLGEQAGGMAEAADDDDDQPTG